MFTLKERNESAQTIATALKLPVTEKASVIFMRNAENEASIYAKALAKGMTDDEKSIAKRKVTNAVDLYNDSSRLDRLESLKGEKSADADAKYLADQSVPGISFDEKNCRIIDADKNGKINVYIMPYDYFSYCNPTALNGITDACFIVTDNIAKLAFKDESAYISGYSLSAKYIAMREHMGWTVDFNADGSPMFGKSKIASQLTQLFHMMMPGVTDKAINADVEYLRTAVIDGKDNCNGNGQLVIKKAPTVINFVFRAMYTRHNGGKYVFQNADKLSQAVPVSFVEDDNKEPKPAPLAQPSEKTAEEIAQGNAEYDKTLETKVVTTEKNADGTTTKKVVPTEHKEPKAKPGKKSSQAKATK